MGRKFLGTTPSSGADLATMAQIASGSTSGINPRLDQLLQSASASFNNNVRTRGLYTGATVVSTDTLPGGYGAAKTVTDTCLSVYGGNAVAATDNGNSGYTVKVTTSSSGVTSGVTWRVETYVDGDAVVISTARTGNFRLIIDGRYVSLSALSASGTGQVVYHTVTFGTRATRQIILEGDNNAVFYNFRVKSTDTLLLPTTAKLRLVIVGDSNTAGTSQTLLHSSLASVMGDHLGISDVWNGSISSTGFGASGGGYNYIQRSSDWTAPASDMILFWGSANDPNQGVSAATVKANAASALATARAARPGVPIFVIGMAGSTEYFVAQGLYTQWMTYETALSEACSEANDPLIAFIPFLSYAGQNPLTGTGSGTGNWDLYNLPDGHLSTAGHLYMGAWCAQRLAEAVAKMAGADIPAFVPAPVPGTFTGNTDAVTEGTTNLYFTQARVLSTPMTSLSTATATAVVATDTNLVAVGKLQAQVTARATIASPTFTGKVTTAASATGGAGFNLPHGAAPTSPANGDVWTTTAAAFVRLNGATAQLATTGSNTFTGKVTTVASATGGAGLNLPHGAAPTTPTNGDLWSTTTGLFVRLNGATAQMAPLAAPTFTGSITTNGSVRQTVSAVGALNIDCSLSNSFSKTIAANSTLTFSNVPASGTFYSCVIVLTHTSGTLTHPTGTIFSGGTAPTLTTGKVHLMYYQTNDGGTTWRCSILKDYAS